MRGLLGLEKAAKLWEEREGVMDDLMAGMEGEGVRREGLVSAGNDWEGVRPLTVDDVAAAVAVGGGENITSGLIGCDCIVLRPAIGGPLDCVTIPLLF